MNRINDVHSLTLRDLEPRVRSLMTYGDSVEVLEDNGWKIEDMRIFPGDETNWVGVIKFYGVEKGVLFEHDDLNRILCWFAALSEYALDGEINDPNHPCYSEL